MRLLLFLFFVSTATALELPSVKPSTGTIHRWLTLPGSLAPWQQAKLHAKVTGYVVSLTVDKGDSVKAGQILAVLEVPELLAEQAKAKAEVAAASIELKRLQEAKAKAPALVLPQKVDDAEARLSTAQAEKNRCDTQLSFATLRAPFDGIITARYADPGALATAQITALLEVTDFTQLRLQIPVTELETRFVSPERIIKAQIDALGTAATAGGTPSPIVLEASISRISYALDPATRTMLAEADLPNPELKLRPGMYAMTKISAETHTGATLIPTTALVMEKTNAFVFKHVDGKAVKTAVKPVFNDGSYVELPELKTTDVLLIPGTATLTDKQPVTLK
jgi:RND family efflux transporter MFP subunit